MIKRTRVETFLELQKELLTDIEVISKEVCALRQTEDLSGRGFCFTPGKTTIDEDGDGLVNAGWEVHWRYGGYESLHISFPVDYFWTDWRPIELEKRRHTIAKQDLINRVQERELEAEERKTFAELKMKFEGPDASD